MKSSTCMCLCEPCPDKQTMCISSGACIDESLWCDGFQDCPDDEIDCKKEEPVVKAAQKQDLCIVELFYFYDSNIN